MSTEQWEKLQAQLLKEYPRSNVLVSWKSKEILGFTPRLHREFTPYKSDPEHFEKFREFICLDFYDDRKQTMFCLKYSEYIQKRLG